MSTTNPHDRRLILDRGFERATETVLDAFLQEGFTVRPIDAGNLHQRANPGSSLRYAMLEATLPELSVQPRGVAVDTPALLACRLCLFELTESCTLLTAEHPIARYPLLASVAARVADRMAHALRTVICAGVLTAA